MMRERLIKTLAITLMVAAFSISGTCAVGDTGNIDETSAGGYNLLPISIILITGYIFTHYLFNKGVLTRQKHIKIWNIIIIAGYLVTGVTGVVLTIMVNMYMDVLNSALTFWHVEFAIIMVVGTLIHIHLHRKTIQEQIQYFIQF